LTNEIDISVLESIHFGKSAPNLESRKILRAQHFNVGTLDVSAHPSRDIAEERINVARFPFGHQLDLSAGQVANEAGYRMPSSEMQGGLAKAHPLHQPRIEDAFADFHDKLSTQERGRKFSGRRSQIADCRLQIRRTDRR
jgi:hypothetical protein